MESKIIKRDELYERVWREPATKVAAAYGISGNGLAKICKKLDVPLPTRGYWQRKAVGTAPAATPLPALKPGAPTEHRVVPPPPKSPPVERAPETRVAIAAEAARPVIEVPEEVAQYDPLVRRARTMLRDRKKDDRGPWDESACLAINVSPAMLDRALRMFHVIIVELRARDLTVVATEPRQPRSRNEIGSSRTHVSVLGVTLDLSIAEPTIGRRVEKPPVLPPGRRRKPLPPHLRHLGETTHVRVRARREAPPPNPRPRSQGTGELGRPARATDREVPQRVHAPALLRGGRRSARGRAA